MKTAEEILEDKIKPRYKPDGFGGFKELIIEAMKEYAIQYLKVTNDNDCYFCKHIQDDIHNRPEFCTKCFDADDNPHFELP